MKGEREGEKRPAEKGYVICPPIGLNPGKGAGKRARKKKKRGGEEGDFSAASFTLLNS